MTTRAGPRRGAGSVGRPPVAILGIATLAFALVAVPLVALLRRVAWSNLWSDLSSPGSVEALRLSLICSVAAAIASVVLGLPLAWTLARVPFAGRRFVRALVLVPMVLPPVVGGVALLSAFARRGIVGGWLYDALGVQLTFSTAGAILAETFVAMPFFVITAEAAFRAADPQLEDAAAALGVGPWRRLWRVAIPAARPSLVAGVVLAWARALGEFGATVTFAGNIGGRTRTLPLAVNLALDGDPHQALALSVVLLAVSVTVIAALRDRWMGDRSTRRSPSS